MNDLHVNTLLAVSTNIETEQITNGNLKLKGNGSFEITHFTSLVPLATVVWRFCDGESAIRRWPAEPGYHFT
jgi:hypothetical protein